MTLQEFILEFSPYDNITGYKNIYINSHNMISFEGGNTILQVGV